MVTMASGPSVSQVTVGWSGIALSSVATTRRTTDLVTETPRTSEKPRRKDE
jgi:hypothetical protein